MPRIEFIYPLLCIVGFGLPIWMAYSPRRRPIGWLGSIGFLIAIGCWWALIDQLREHPPAALPGDRGWLGDYLIHVRQLGIALLAGSWVVLRSGWDPISNPTWHRTFFNRFASLAQNRGRCVSMIGIAAFGIGALFSAIHPPIPRVHDEFSYLLAADTFAHGRLTNPTHPDWVHFESIHVFHQPTYMSKYPPAQGLTLALGQVLTGSPIPGIWLGTAIGCASVCWMLYGWLPPQWALLGGILTLVSPTIQTNWGQSFQGGGLAMAGGALAFGAGARILTYGGVRNAVVLAIGVSILAISRPFEGVVAILPLAVVIAAWLISSRGGSRVEKLITIALPFTAVMCLTLAAIGYDNWKVTGKITRFPYQNDELIYWTKNPFGVSIKAEPIAYSSPILRQFFESAAESDHSEGTLAGHAKQAFAHFTKRIIWILTLFYFRLHLLIPLGVSLLAIRNRRVSFAVLTISLVFITHAFVLFYWPHYTAPVVGLFFFLIIEGLRHLWLRGGRLGSVLVIGVVLTSLLELIASGWHRQDPTPGFHLDRARVVAELESTPGLHLVLVRYTPDHDPAYEWVYNGADLNGSKVLWARDRREDHNQVLLERYRDRTVWFLDADAIKPVLRTLGSPSPADAFR